MEHTVKFERNTRTGRWRAVCSCSWLTIGTKVEVQALAATHDVEWVEASPEPYSPYPPSDVISVVSDGPGATASISIVPSRVIDNNGNEVPQ